MSKKAKQLEQQIDALTKERDNFESQLQETLISLQVGLRLNDSQFTELANNHEIT